MPLAAAFGGAFLDRPNMRAYSSANDAAARTVFPDVAVAAMA